MTAQATYLVEILDDVSGDVVHCDITRYLQNALEIAYRHLVEVAAAQLTPQVSLNDDGLLEGIAFFDNSNRSRGFITVYHLEHDALENEVSALGHIAALPAAQLEAALGKFFG